MDVRKLSQKPAFGHTRLLCWTCIRFHRDRSIDRVSVIINLAHALKLNTVAEGVETEEQLRQLRLLHCDEMQGYLFGKPVPVEDFESKYLVAERRRRMAR